jgi:two-component system, cell cycle response regulator
MKARLTHVAHVQRLPPPDLSDTAVPLARAKRILIANDQEWAARAVETILVAEGYEVQRAYTGRQALDRALESLPDLIILDTQMPDLSGPEVCRQLRADPRIGPATPILLSTAGPAGRQQRIEAHSAGAWEFYGQPLDPEILLLKIRIYLEVKAASDHLNAEVLVDTLTGLYNAKGLLRRTEEVLSDARRHQREVGLLTLSLTDPVRDAVLEESGELARKAGGLVRGAVRGSDVVGRIGPLRFAILSAGGSTEGIRVLADRLVQALSGIGNGRGTVAVSATIQEVSPEQLTQLEARTLIGELAPLP